ncbi:MAG TPA: hypothetical protein DCE44_12955 [Verrucomicrobiales bacterium]|nr:hypothetical protein [Verrucomicrobiales bacterium]
MPIAQDDARTHRPPPEAGAGSESSIPSTGAPEVETGSGGSGGAILLGISFQTTIATAYNHNNYRLEYPPAKKRWQTNVLK